MRTKNTVWLWGQALVGKGRPLVDQPTSKTVLWTCDHFSRHKETLVLGCQRLGYWEWHWRTHLGNAFHGAIGFTIPEKSDFFMIQDPGISTIFLFIIFIYLDLCLWESCWNVCLCTMYIPGAEWRRPEEGTGCPELELLSQYVGAWEPNLGPPPSMLELSAIKADITNYHTHSFQVNSSDQLVYGSMPSQF